MKEILKRKLLAELLKNSRRSDRQLARVLDSSQPTITRTRQKIEREGIVRSYTFIPDWRKLHGMVKGWTCPYCGYLIFSRYSKGGKYVLHKTSMKEDESQDSFELGELYAEIRRNWRKG